MWTLRLFKKSGEPVELPAGGLVDGQMGAQVAMTNDQVIEAQVLDEGVPVSGLQRIGQFVFKTHFNAFGERI